MSFEFKCPSCNHIITEADFNKNEQVLSHLNEIFKVHENNYVKGLEVKLIAQHKIEQDKAIKSALIVKENELLKSNQKQLDQLKQIIAEQKSKLENNSLELEKTLSQQENKLNQAKNIELTSLKAQIIKLENDKEAQKLMLDKLLAQKETDLLKSNQKELDKLNQIISEQKSKLENNNLELTSSLSQQENKLNQAKHSEILILRNQIQELEKANQQFRVIQNKIKGENFEHEVETELRKTFEPDDIISKITNQDKKADYLQEVRQDKTIIGKIVYEVKNAEWSNNWEKKLVDDMAKQGSKYGILIATSFNNKYAGIPFKRSDYNSNIYLTDSESFYFVGQILKTLIKIEYRLDSKHDKTDYNQKIKQFSEWKTTQLPKLDSVLNESLTKIDRLADLITDRAQDIKKEKAKVYKTWIENIKDYLDNFIF